MKKLPVKSVRGYCQLRSSKYCSSGFPVLAKDDFSREVLLLYFAVYARLRKKSVCSNQRDYTILGKEVDHDREKKSIQS